MQSDANGALKPIEDELEAQLEQNPNLIIPFIAENDDCESQFTLPMKKCRKPRGASNK